MAKSIDSVNYFKIAGEDTPAAVADLAAITAVALDDDTGGSADAEGDLVESAGANPTAAEFENNFATTAVAVNALVVDVTALRTKVNALLEELRVAGVLPR